MKGVFRICYVLIFLMTIFDLLDNDLFLFFRVRLGLLKLPISPILLKIFLIGTPIPHV